MAGRNDRIPSVKDGFESQPWMHVFGQATYHYPVKIRGSRKALEGLRDATIQALEDGEGFSQAFAADGEGYDVHVSRVNLIASLGEPEYLLESAGKNAVVMTVQRLAAAEAELLEAREKIKSLQGGEARLSLLLNERAAELSEMWAERDRLRDQLADRSSAKG